MPVTPPTEGRAAAGGMRVLIVDDSAVVRQVLVAILTHAGMEVETAPDPLIGQTKLARFRPDVIVLDLEMPRMDGATWLGQLMAETPLPVVICSAMTGRFAHAAVRALAAGAVDVITKPQIGVRGFLEKSAENLVEVVRAAAGARIGRLARRAPPPPETPRPVGLSAAKGATTPAVVALGASTGGTEALRTLLAQLPADGPGLVIVQHMPAGFTRAFAEHLDQAGPIAVKEAESGDRVLPGRALVARGGHHLVLRKSGYHLIAEITDGPPVSRHRPSVDVLFSSTAKAAGAAAVGVLLTGMGDDGAKGLLEMRRAGAYTIAQDEATSVVFGMPRQAIALDAAAAVAPLGKIAQLLLRPGG
jgi:two-component system, chemotaxis family, protein-glutamate methylesterase/glutaminase